MGVFSSKPLDRTIRFERPVPDPAFDGPGSGTWVAVATVRANVEELRVARSERLADIVNIEARPATVLIRHRDDITSDMRIAIGSLDLPDDPQPADRQYLEIVAGPVRLGRREALEMRTQEFSTRGNGN